MNLGPVPIRVSLSSTTEAVWCQRIDPARAIIRNVPLPECQHAYGDLFLHDGERKGVRMLGNHEVPVFNEREILTPSTIPTFRADVTAPDSQSVADLYLQEEVGVSAIEDWSGMERLCVLCSEGRPHDQHEPTKA